MIRKELRKTMSIAGSWNVTIATPLGKQSIVLDLNEKDGVVKGVAKGDAETTPLIDPVLDGDRLLWGQTITKPMKLKLIFDVTFRGDALSGTAQAGLLPSSKVTGYRATEGAAS